MAKIREITKTAPDKTLGHLTRPDILYSTLLYPSGLRI